MAALIPLCRVLKHADLKTTARGLARPTQGDRDTAHFVSRFQMSSPTVAPRSPIINYSRTSLPWRNVVNCECGRKHCELQINFVNAMIRLKQCSYRTMQFNKRLNDADGTTGQSNHGE
jgi:hypothetical protein